MSQSSTGRRAAVEVMVGSEVARRTLNGVLHHTIAEALESHKLPTVHRTCNVRRHARCKYSFYAQVATIRTHNPDDHGREISPRHVWLTTRIQRNGVHNERDGNALIVGVARIVRRMQACLHVHAFRPTQAALNQRSADSRKASSHRTEGAEPVEKSAPRPISGGARRPTDSRPRAIHKPRPSGSARSYVHNRRVVDDFLAQHVQVVVGVQEREDEEAGTGLRGWLQRRACLAPAGATLNSRLPAMRSRTLSRLTTRTVRASWTARCTSGCTFARLYRGPLSSVSVGQ